MTRINLVSPSQLTDKHLMAEYRELPRIFTSVVKLQDQGKSQWDVEIPSKYVLGKGHMKFFYNKLGWLKERYESLYRELIRREFDLNHQLAHDIIQSTKKIDSTWFESYNPTPDEIYLNMARLCKRSNINEVLNELQE